MATSTLGSGTLVLAGTTSGTTTVTATAVAGTTTLTLPAATDTLVGKATTDTLTNKTLTAPTLASANITTALTLTGASGTNGQALTSGGSGNAPTWTTIGATPGGSTTQVQYNNAGAFGGISGVTTDGTRMTASTTIGVGAATPSISGAGITFPATQSASSDANTLDDYEEGTWPPSVSSMTTTGTPAYAGMYTKIGRVVTVTFYTTTANSGVATYATIAGTTNVSGLPFSANAVIPNAAGGFAGIAINGNTNTGGFVQGPNSGTTFYFNSAITASQGISASITYYSST